MSEVTSDEWLVLNGITIDGMVDKTADMLRVVYADPRINEADAVVALAAAFEAQNNQHTLAGIAAHAVRRLALLKMEAETDGR